MTVGTQRTTVVARRTIVRPGFYQDSVSLMRVAGEISKVAGVQMASAVMGTDANKELLAVAGLLTDEARAASANDLVLVVSAASDDAADLALEKAQQQLEGQLAPSGEQAGAAPVRTVAAAVAARPDANVLVVSTPGQYAGAEALKALKAGLHAFLFSDNVPLSQDIALKAEGRRRGLLVMGPDCGTSILDGVGLGFANAVARGPIGVVGPSGTGLQMVTVLADRLGSGISHAIGTGSHDLSDAIGGTTTLQGLEVLAEDPDTAVIVLVSKPPSPQVAQEVLTSCEKIDKPVVVNFLGLRPDELRVSDGITATRTLEEAARVAVAAASGSALDATSIAPEIFEAVTDGRSRQGAGQRYLRGLFSGGTLCTEALVILSDLGVAVNSNVPLVPDLRLEDLQTGVEHTCIDMGADEFTVGRPHPMIDLRARIERLHREAQDPAVAVVLLDVVLGYGSHADPAAELAPAIRDACGTADADGRHLVVLGSVCGTDRDPQQLAKQEAALHGAGMVVVPSNAQAARVAAVALGVDIQGHES